MKKRAGLTLVEVLVAIFVMAIGMLSVLALFPAGAIAMRDAIKDTRAAMAGSNAAAIAQFQNLRSDPTVVGAFPTTSTVTVPPSDQASLVYVDPFGASQYQQIGTMKRCGASYATSTVAQLKWFTLLDDVTFSPNNGTPVDAAANMVLPVKRTSTYSWAYLLRRRTTPQTTGTPSPVVEMSVVVYSGRGTLYLPQEPSYSGITITNAGATAPRNVTIQWGSSSSNASMPRPGIQRGGWVLDSTNGFCYRVVDMVDVNATTLQIELQTPVRSFNPTTGAPTLGPWW